MGDLLGFAFFLIMDVTGLDQTNEKILLWAEKCLF